MFNDPVLSRLQVCIYKTQTIQRQYRRSLIKKCSWWFQTLTHYFGVKLMLSQQHLFLITTTTTSFKMPLLDMINKCSVNNWQYWSENYFQLILANNNCGDCKLGVFPVITLIFQIDCIIIPSYWAKAVMHILNVNQITNSRDSKLMQSLDIASITDEIRIHAYLASKFQSLVEKKPEKNTRILVNISNPQQSTQTLILSSKSTCFF